MQGELRLRLRAPDAEKILLESLEEARDQGALEVLIALASRPGELVTKEELVADVWPDVAVDESNLRAQVAALRKALRDGQGGARYVATVPGRGYRFVSPVSRVTRSSAKPPAQRPRLPARLTRPVGRDEIVAAIGARLQRRRFLTIVGPGGIGKTTVALAAADAPSDDYPDGVCLVDLAPLADAGNVPSAFVSALGLTAVSGDPTAAAIGFLRERSLLVVLDSCEHVLESAAMLAERVLRGAAGVHVLATSREPLRAEGESVQRLAPLEAPPASAWRAGPRSSTGAFACWRAGAAPRCRATRRSAPRSTGATSSSPKPSARCCAASPSSPAASGSSPRAPSRRTRD